MSKANRRRALRLTASQKDLLVSRHQIQRETLAAYLDPTPTIRRRTLPSNTPFTPFTYYHSLEPE